ncbi:MAG: 50S ribosomal protein L1 [Candidatus Uhrbacteria bacterium]|nr:50S ribosomal protein L1 [Candidatus Uhrbacteria bacterium]
MSHGKRYQELKKLIDPKKLYPPEEALDLVKQTGKTKFDATIEVHLNLGIDVKKGEQQVRSTMIFPHSIGKAKRVAAFVTPEKEKDAKEAGADIVGGEELIAEIAKTNKTDFDVAVATPDMMVKLAKIAKILGPSGLMPNPKTETVGPNIKKMIEEVKRGKISFKNDITGNIHQAIGKVSMGNPELLQNFTMFLEAVKKSKPASSKGTYLKSVTLASTMGPGIHVDASKI